MADWSDQELRTLLKMTAAGYTTGQIAEALGRTGCSVRRRLHRWRADSTARLANTERVVQSADDRVQQLQRIPFARLSSVQVRIVVERSAQDVDTLAARWGVAPAEVRYRAGVVG